MSDDKIIEQVYHIDVLEEAYLSTVYQYFRFSNNRKRTEWSRINNINSWNISIINKHKTAISGGNVKIFRSFDLSSLTYQNHNILYV